MTRPHRTELFEHVDQVADAVADGYGLLDGLPGDGYGMLGIFRVFQPLDKRIADIMDTHDKVVEKGGKIAEWRLRTMARSMDRLIQKKLKKNPKWKVPDRAIEVMEDGGLGKEAAKYESRGSSKSKSGGGGSSGSGPSAAQVDALVSRGVQIAKSGSDQDKRKIGAEIMAAVEARTDSDDAWEPPDAVYEVLEALGVDDEGAAPAKSSAFGGLGDGWELAVRAGAVAGLRQAQGRR